MYNVIHIYINMFLVSSAIYKMYISIISKNELFLLNPLRAITYTVAVTDSSCI